MLNYFGISFLVDLQNYYGNRLRQALVSGFDQKDHKYHWLYEELAYRTNCVRQTCFALEAMPAFLMHAKSEDAFTYIYGMTTKWFRAEATKAAPKRDDGTCYFYSDECPYWTDLQVSFDLFGNNYDYDTLPVFYVDLVEYVICSVRLHFFIRESLLRPIDRGKFDELMKWNPDFAKSA